MFPYRTDKLCTTCCRGALGEHLRHSKCQGHAWRCVCVCVLSSLQSISHPSVYNTIQGKEEETLETFIMR